jgi:hypothetical protein
LVVGCGADFTTSIGDETTAEDSPLVSTAAVGTSSAPESQSVIALGDIKQVMQVFVQDDPTLDLTVGADDNTSNVVLRAESLLAQACPAVSVQHQPGSTEVSAQLEHCTLQSGLVVSGDVTVSIERRDLEQGGELTVSFNFTELTLGTLAVDGSVLVTTADLKDYPLSADLLITPLGHLKFEGTAEVTVANPPEVTLDGTGEFTKSALTGSTEIGVYDWSCAGVNPSALTVTGLHRVYGQCHADGGTIDVAKAYECTKSIRGQLVSKTVQSDVDLQWSKSSPEDDTISAQLTMKTDEQTRTGAETPVTLPWSCD